MKSSVLAVGTEITSGQITNRNAAWVSQKMTKLGLQTSIHHTVPDEHSAIRQGLKLLENESDLIFVTGGLGPTSDDFTRDLITEWAGVELVFDEKSWIKIKTRLQERGLPVQDFQKQQCYFPKGSHILENSQGTANAFYLKTRNKHLWALPGPPNEIAQVWQDHIEKQLEAITQDVDAFMTKSWDVIGLGEAVAPSLIEPLVKDLPVEVGYRVHMPYLEIKISFFKSQQSRLEKNVFQVDEALKNYICFRNGEEVLQKLSPLLESTSHLHITDEVTEGLLLSRISAVKKKNLSYSDRLDIISLPENSCHIHCAFSKESEVFLNFTGPGQPTRKITIKGPSNLAAHMTERRRLYYTEMVLISTLKEWSPA